jgi:nucleotide-binding universal stress UspA family protein
MIGGAMFKTLVVAVNLEAGGDCALDVTEALARGTSVDVNLVTVCDPATPAADAALGLQRRASRHGFGAHAWTIVHDSDVPGALLEHAARRDDSLLVMGTTRRHVSASSIEHSVSRDVVRRTDRPVLLVGPAVAPDKAMRCTTPVLCVDHSDLARRAVSVMVEWQASFPGAAPWIVEVVGPGDDERPARQRLASLVALLADRGMQASTTLEVADDPVTGLDDLAARLDGPVFVATSARYIDGHLHLFSTAQRLVQHGHCPVLVVPATPASTRCARSHATEHSEPDAAAAPSLV